jgi:hypothetical protein
MASGTLLPVLQLIAKIVLAAPPMRGKLAKLTKLGPASVVVMSPLGGVHDSLAIGSGAQPKVEVCHRLLSEGFP